MRCKELRSSTRSIHTLSILVIPYNTTHIHTHRDKDRDKHIPLQQRKVILLLIILFPLYGGRQKAESGRRKAEERIGGECWDFNIIIELQVWNILWP